MALRPRRLAGVVSVVLALACSKKADTTPVCGGHAPAATASAMPNSVSPTQPIQLTATSTDADDACGAPTTRTYVWTVVSRPITSSAVIADPASPATTFTPDVAGEYQLSVVATDAVGQQSAPAFVNVTATGCGLVAPSVAPFAAASGVLGASTTLPQPTYTDSNCLAASGPVTYRWAIASRPPGSAAILDDPSKIQPVLTPDAVGPWQLSVVVTDAAGMSSQPAFLDLYVSTCGTAAPVVGALLVSPAAPNVGQLVTVSAPSITDPNQTTCGATGTTPYRYLWKLVAAPKGSAAALASETADTAAFVPDVPNGTWQLALTVTDALGVASAPAFVSVTSASCGANPPVVSLVPATSMPNGNTATPIAATITDADDSPACGSAFATAVTGVAWTVTTAPPGAHPVLASSRTVPSASGTAFQDANAFQADVAGTYVVQAIATASNGTESAPALATLTVSACGTHPPVVTQIASSSSAPPVGSAVTLTASHADPDDASGGPCSPPMPGPTYEWTLVSAPAGSTVLAPLGPQPTGAMTFTPNVAGTYAFSVVAIDAQGLASAPMSIAVTTATCGPTLSPLPGFAEPIAALSPAVPAPGGGYSANLGTPVDLQAGAASDVCIAGGAAPAYAWRLASVPSGSVATLSGAAGQTPSFTPDMRGLYSIELVVTDAAGYASTFTTTVDAECGNPPAVAAVPGFPSTPDFRMLQVVGGVNGAQTLTLVRASGPAGSLALLDGVSSPLVPFYPGVPVGLSANVVASATCQQTIAYQWSLVGQPVGSLAAVPNPFASSPSFVPDVPGTYVFRLVLTDQTGRSTTTTLATDAGGAPVGQVGACGTAVPVVSARAASPIGGAPGALTDEPTSRVTLLASATDADAVAYPAGCGLQRPLTYAWSFLSVPTGSAAALSSATAVDPSFVASPAGRYALAVDVSDGSHVTRATVDVDAVASVTSTAATPGAAVYTSVAADLNGNPVVAWWDPVAGAVEVARCTAGCSGGGTPVWTAMPVVDSGIAAFAGHLGEEEARPVAVKVSGAGTAAALTTGGTILVAYYTGDGTTSTASGQPPCNLTVAQWDGAQWNRAPVPSPRGPSTTCATGGFAEGRYLSMDLDPASGGPIVGFSEENGTTWTDALFTACNTPACTTNIQGAAYVGPAYVAANGSLKWGRWVSVRARGDAVDAVFYADDFDGAGSKGLFYSTCNNGGTCLPNPTFPTFAPTPVDASAGADVGRFSSLAVVPAGSPASGSSAVLAAAYRDTTGAVARTARCVLTSPSACTSPSAWTSAAIVDAPASYGRDAVAAADASGRLRVAYLDDATGEVRLLAPDSSGAFQLVATLASAASPAGLSFAFGAGTVMSASQQGGAFPVVVFTGP